MTKEWFQFLSNLEVEILNNWAESVYVGESLDETVQRNSAALGQIDLVRRLQQATYEQIEEIKDDNKH
jgi:hypothetical protein